MCSSPQNKITRMGYHRLKREQQCGATTRKQWGNVTRILCNSYTRRVWGFHLENEWKLNEKMCGRSHKIIMVMGHQWLKRNNKVQFSLGNNVKALQVLSSNRSVLRIIQRLLGALRFPYQERLLLNKYKDTSICHQMSEGF